VLRAGEIPILRGCENAVVATRGGVGVIVPEFLNLVITVLVIIPVNVCLHDLMFVRFAIVRAVLRADQRRSQCGHRESRQ